MRNVFSAVLFAVIFIGLGALVFASAPTGDNVAVLPDAPEAQVVAGAPQAAVAAVGNYNAISMVLDNGITNSTALMADVTSTTGVTATDVVRYDPTLGFVPASSSGQFPVTVGQPLFVRAQGLIADTYTIVGDVPPAGSINYSLSYNSGACTYNFISLPLDQGAITNAYELGTDIGDVVRVVRYDVTLGFLPYEMSAGPGDPGFGVSIGYPYFVCVSAAKSWPN
jgi:hypothetical protein